ncbi:MAG: hypothetical protein ACOX7J_01205 [Bacillota bacterium]
MNIKKITSTLMAAFMLVGVAALPVFAAETAPDIESINTVDYVDEMLKAVEGYEGDIPMDIAVNPMEEETVEMDGGCCNPFIKCADLNQAAQMTGFSLSVPTTPDGVSVLEDSNMIQADYENGMYIRKASGSDDISGDYSDYSQVKTVNGVTLKGENWRFSIAIWNNDGYTYAVGVHEAMTQSDMLALVANIK